MCCWWEMCRGGFTESCTSHKNWTKSLFCDIQWPFPAISPQNDHCTSWSGPSSWLSMSHANTLVLRIFRAKAKNQSRLNSSSHVFDNISFRKKWSIFFLFTLRYFKENKYETIAFWSNSFTWNTSNPATNICSRWKARVHLQLQVFEKTFKFGNYFRRLVSLVPPPKKTHLGPPLAGAQKLSLKNPRECLSQKAPQEQGANGAGAHALWPWLQFL